VTGVQTCALPISSKGIGVAAYVPYARQWIDDEDIRAVVSTLKSDFLTQGPEVERFENSIKKVTSARYCVAVSSASAGLMLAVAAMGIEENLEGITSPNTFVASASCLVQNRLNPRFVDIDARTLCIDPIKIEAALNERTRILVPVHFAGQPADMRKIKKLADRDGLKVVEDAAHAIGSCYPDGSSVGSCEYSDCTVFSFHAVKTITTGEGGAITTNDPELYRRLVQLRSHGITRDQALMEKNPGPWYYEMISLGFNCRLTDIQAALGARQLEKLEVYKARRQAIFQRYQEAFASVPHVTCPSVTDWKNVCLHLYVLQFDLVSLRKTRAQLMADLRAEGIGTQVHYIPVHLQPYFRDRFGTRPGDCPISESYYERALSLPFFPKLTDAEVERVIQAVVRMGS
jgi:UDP-4-amino-4,6-dideoxy-N-acetyl-beta-L-altrosamine transaminase